MKAFSFLGLILGLMIFVSSSHAFYVTEDQECSPIDLRSEFNWKLRNQGEISWCYAHAAADYLQFYQNVNTPISAADIALEYGRRNWPRLMKWIYGGVVPETGFIRWALFDASLKGYCPEEYFPSETWSKRILQGQERGAIIPVPIKTAMEEVVALAKNVKLGLYREVSDLPYVFEFKDMSPQQFTDAIFYRTPDEVILSLKSAACDSHRQPYPRLITDVAMRPAGRKTFIKINQILERHQPLTVDFFYGFLNNADSFKRSLANLHTTLLVGRRFDPAQGECQYLIKNSYGPDCSEYDSRHTCESGYVWVAERFLYSAMTSFVYIRESVDDFTGNASQIQDEPNVQSR